jgi:hypothetical protein
MNSCLDYKIVPDDGQETDDPPDPPVQPPVAKKNVKVNTGIEDVPFGPQRFTNERIGLFVYKNADMLVENNPVQLENGSGAFEYTDSYLSGSVFGYYPFAVNGVSVIGTVYNGFLDSVQNQQVLTNANITAFPQELANKLLMVSDRSDEFSFEGEAGDIQFRNVFSLFQFKITKEPSLRDFENQKIKNFRMYLSSGDQLETPASYIAIAGTYTVDIRKAATNQASLKPDFSRESNVISGTVSNNPNPAISSAPEEALVIWVLTAPFNVYYSKLVFRMETENSDGSIRYSTLNAFNIENITRNTLNSYNVVLTKENVHTDDLVNESMVDYPANTYILSEAGTYAISTKTPSGSNMTGDNVTWLWASSAGGGNTFDNNNLLGDIEYDRVAGIIKFRAGMENGDFNKGNVILALRDASNRIVWTWHIWLTDPPQDILHERKYFMDRNLGALSADTSIRTVRDAYGFVYQWGRKDPFYGGDGVHPAEGDLFSIANLNTRINNAVSWNGNAAQWSVAAAAVGTVDMATEFPMQFISNHTAVASDYVADWFGENSNGFWHDTEKTDKDPCPYGYKVPSKEDMAPFWITTPTANYHFEFKNNKYWEYKYPPGSESCWISGGRRQGRHSYNTEDGNEGPNGGKMAYSGTDSSRGRLFYWTSTTTALFGSGGAYRLYSPSDILYSDNFGDKADACSVRCVKMQP